jgi:undecaprenyl-diphosphatase
MITFFQVIILGIIQGFTELFPISSLGHSVILPKLFGWNIHQSDPYFIVFLVATHTATALVLLYFFRKDWLKIVKGLGRSLKNRRIDRNDTYAKLGWLLVVGSIPAGILGLLLQSSLQTLFASAQFAAFFLMINGIILYGAEKLRTRPHQKVLSGDDKNIARLSWTQSIFVGAAQAGALIPGISRSGSSMAGGLMVGLNNEDAARFSFLLATPIIAAAALLKLPELFGSSANNFRAQALVGAVFAGLSAYISVRFLLRFFKSNRLTPFAIYCFCAGSLLSVYFLFT